MPFPTEPTIVRHPDAPDVLVTLDPREFYEPDDSIVRVYGWAFEPRAEGAGLVESVSVERATAAPGEKRTLRPRR